MLKFVGGTSVSSALECPTEEHRCIISVDLSEMNKVIWIDSRNQLCRAEAGIIGVDLEEKVLVYSVLDWFSILIWCFCLDIECPTCIGKEAFDETTV